ncbi:MAG: multidrug ABC transporter permease [Desulfatitalea sp. BRH_c12]|nr:MAG: multidrug ABC transporter permease [Desulfatitalea sp. BRH_c12]
MSFKRLWAMLWARNHEFFRDRAAFGWNFMFPFLLVAGFAVIFGGDEPKDFKVGIFPCDSVQAAYDVDECLPPTLKGVRQVQYLGFENLEQGLDKLRHHRIDLLIEKGSPPFRYWVSNSSPKGYTVEKILIGNLVDDADRVMARQEVVTARQIRYIDWLFPGIIGMNMMFSALYGVGFVVVRYRKNGVLKRLKATPLTAFEYLTAQMLSRLFVLAFTLIILWVGCDLIFRFTVEGSYVDLLLIFLLGSLSLTSLGLVIASRGTSEEFSNGVLNFITWPMMFLSEVWFSIEGAPHWVKLTAKAFPLTHMLSAVRKIMNDGATLADVSVELAFLIGFTLLFLIVGASLFSWNK